MFAHFVSHNLYWLLLLAIWHQSCQCIETFYYVLMHSACIKMNGGCTKIWNIRKPLILDNPPPNLRWEQTSWWISYSCTIWRCNFSDSTRIICPWCTTDLNLQVIIMVNLLYSTNFSKRLKSNNRRRDIRENILLINGRCLQ